MDPLLIEAGKAVVLAAGGWFAHWIKERNRAAEMAALRKERDEERAKNSRYREQHENQAVRIAHLEEANRRLKGLRSVAQDRVPPTERAYFEDTGISPPDLEPRR